MYEIVLYLQPKRDILHFLLTLSAHNRYSKYMPASTPITPSVAVKAAFDYLKTVSPDSSKFTNFRVEEIARDEDGGFTLTLGYDVAGEFGFDTKRELKQFRVAQNGDVEWMKIRKL